MEENMISLFERPEFPCPLANIPVSKLLKQRIIVVRQFDVRDKQVHRSIPLAGYAAASKLDRKQSIFLVFPR
jgi:hypothetical protein